MKGLQIWRSAGLQVYRRAAARFFGLTEKGGVRREQRAAQPFLPY